MQFMRVTGFTRWLSLCRLILGGFLMLLLNHTALAQQCPFDNAPAVNPPLDITLSGAGDSVVNNCVKGGEYVRVNVCIGAHYFFKTCTTPGFLDSKITVYDSTGTNVLVWNDDAVNCGVTGWLSEASLVSPYTGLIYVLVDQSGGTSCIHDNNCYVLTVVQATPCCDEPDIITQNVRCYGENNGIAIAIGKGQAPWDYKWKDSTGAFIRQRIGVNGPDTLRNLPPGSYSVIVEETGVCVITKIFIIEEPPPLNITATILADSCQPGGQGMIDITPGGGTPPYQFTWSNGSSLEDLTGITGGNYQLTIQDANNCSDTLSYTVTTGYPSGPAGIWTWNGSIDSLWFNPCNWDKTTVPDSSSIVIIPGNTPFNPYISGGIASCKSITIDYNSGAMVRIDYTSGALLKVNQ